MVHSEIVDFFFWKSVVTLRPLWRDSWAMGRREQCQRLLDIFRQLDVRSIRSNSTHPVAHNSTVLRLYLPVRIDNWARDLPAKNQAAATCLGVFFSRSTGGFREFGKIKVIQASKWLGKLDEIRGIPQEKTYCSGIIQWDKQFFGDQTWFHEINGKSFLNFLLTV